MPHAFLIYLQPVNGNVSLEHPHQYIHGLFYNLLSHIDPELSTKVHSSKDKSFFTLYPQLYKREVCLRLTTLDDELFKPLIQVFLEQGLAGLKLGQADYLLSKVIATPEGSSEAGFMSWQNLHAQKATRKLDLNFISPTTFSTSRSDGKRHYSPLPLPKLVFQSLLKSYQRYSPKPLDAHIEAQVQLVLNEQIELQNYRIESHNTWAGKSKFTGFTGKVRFYYQEHVPEVCSVLAQLGALAFYAGVGAKTSYGLGQVRPATPKQKQRITPRQP